MNATVNKPEQWIAKHWVHLFNTFFITFAILPILAPILLTYGYTNIAEIIYRAYGFTCHQLPSHSDYINGHQIAVCQRCNAIHVTLAVVGLMYALHLFRPTAIRFRWLLLFMIPIAVDGGMAFISELLSVISFSWLWLLGIALMGVVVIFLYKQKTLSWQAILFLAAGPISLLYLQTFGVHQSNWWLRNITGTIYGLGLIWFIYPLMEKGNINNKPDTVELRPT